MAFRKRSLVAIGVGARLDVDTVSLEDMFSHGLETLGPVDIQRYPTPDGPWREYQIRVPYRMIGVKMGDKRNTELCRFKRLDALFEERCAGTPHDPRPKVNEISYAVDDDCRGGA
jgi:hypothetical protein